MFEQTKERSDAVQKMIQDKQPTVKYKETQVQTLILQQTERQTQIQALKEQLLADQKSLKAQLQIINAEKQ